MYSHSPCCIVLQLCFVILKFCINAEKRMFFTYQSKLIRIDLLKVGRTTREFLLICFVVILGKQN